ncbi:MAG: DUF4465 domain-containing protein [Paludibacteraceae bacterium]
MKRFFLLLSVFAALTVSASNINLHLVGCTSDAGNPTTLADEDSDSGADLYFTPLQGYTMTGADVQVFHGTTEIPLNDWESEIGYVYFEASMNYLFFCWFDEVTADFEVYVTCQEDKGMDVVLPETFSAATFEEFTLADNTVYRPESFKVGDNWLLSGAVAFNSIVADWGASGKGYSGTQVLNYTPDFVVTNGSDAFLPSAAGAAEGKNYATVNIMSLFEQIHFTKTTLSGFAITNTKVVVNAIINGDGMSIEEAGNSLPFHQDDYFKLTITGLNGETVTGSLDFYLADFRTPGDWKYASDWQWVELSTLGEIDGLQFQLETTKKNTYGATTPSYFCLDNIGGKKEDCKLGAMTKVEDPSASIFDTNVDMPKATKRLINGQLYIEQGGVIYTLMGAKL